MALYIFNILIAVPPQCSPPLALNWSHRMFTFSFSLANPLQPTPAHVMLMHACSVYACMCTWDTPL